MKKFSGVESKSFFDTLGHSRDVPGVDHRARPSLNLNLSSHCSAKKRARDEILWGKDKSSIKTVKTEIAPQSCK